jgi:hypothetical protein
LGNAERCSFLLYPDWFLIYSAVSACPSPAMKFVGVVGQTLQKI